jgi:hypothetical protein
MYLMPAAVRSSRGMGMHHRRGMGAIVRTNLLAPPTRVGSNLPLLNPENNWGTTNSPMYQNPTASTTVPSTNPNTPVPSGFPTNQFFVNTDGSVWEYGANGWFNTGTPYNTAASSTVPISTSTSTTAVSSTTGTPVPAGYPTNAEFINTDGTIWTYNSAVGAWQYSGISQSAAASTTAATTATTAEGDVQSLLDWFSQSTLITGLPNWILAAGAGLVALKFLQPSKGGH